MNSQVTAIGAARRIQRHERTLVGNRKLYPSQKLPLELDRGEKQPTLLYDSRISERLEQLRKDVSDMERRIRRYNTPVSMDNFI